MHLFEARLVPLTQKLVSNLKIRQDQDVTTEKRTQTLCETCCHLPTRPDVKSSLQHFIHISIYKGILIPHISKVSANAYSSLTPITSSASCDGKIALYNTYGKIIAQVLTHNSKVGPLSPTSNNY